MIVGLGTLLVAGMLIPVAHAQGPAATIQHPIEISQVDWDTAATGNVPSSEYGHLRFDFIPDPTQIVFCNIVARMGYTGADDWIVQNMPLLSGTDMGVSAKETCKTVDLAPIGVVRGTTSVGQLIFYTAYTNATAPLSIMPVNTLSDVTQIESTLYRFGAERSIIPVTPSLPPASGPVAKPPWNGSFTIKLAWRQLMPNEEQGTNQCGPSALANSFHWMQNAYPGQVDLGGQTWVDTLLKFKDYTNWDVSDGIGQRDAIEGKLRMGQDPNKFFDPGLVVKYEADANLTDLGAWVTEGGQTAWRHGPTGPPSFDWLLSELQDGEDVEVSIDWLDDSGNKTGGHVASVVGALRFGNKMYVWTNDDYCQGDKEGTPPTPPANGGLRTQLCHQVTIENGGYMRFNGFETNNRIKAIYSESLGDPSIRQFCMPGFEGIIGCPCSNPPAGGGLGCNNFGAGPAESGSLGASGFPEDSIDTNATPAVFLDALGENNTSLTVFFSGKPPAHATGLVHAAGVRCVTVQLRRLYTGSASAGAITRPRLPAGTDPCVSQRHADTGAPLAPPETRLYFNIYRDPSAAGPCGSSSATFNLTNAVAIDWIP